MRMFLITYKKYLKPKGYPAITVQELKFIRTELREKNNQKKRDSSKPSSSTIFFQSLRVS